MAAGSLEGGFGVEVLLSGACEVLVCVKWHNVHGPVAVVALQLRGWPRNGVRAGEDVVWTVVVLRFEGSGDGGALGSASTYLVAVCEAVETLTQPPCGLLGDAFGMVGEAAAERGALGGFRDGAARVPHAAVLRCEPRGAVGGVDRGKHGRVETGIAGRARLRCRLLPRRPPFLSTLVDGLALLLPVAVAGFESILHRLRLGGC